MFLQAPLIITRSSELHSGAKRYRILSSIILAHVTAIVAARRTTTSTDDFMVGRRYVKCCLWLDYLITWLGEFLENQRLFALYALDVR